MKKRSLSESYFPILKQKTGRGSECSDLRYNIITGVEIGSFSCAIAKEKELYLVKLKENL